MPSSLRPRVPLLLALALLPPAMAGVMWVIAAAFPGLLPAGALRWLGIGALLLLGLGLVAALGLARGLSEGVREMQRAHDDLERRLAAAVERGREAEQRALAGQRFEALGQLTGAVAHDFNNLLGVISNSAYLAERHGQHLPELQAPLAATMRAVDAGRRLSQHLQRFAGPSPGRPGRIDLATSLPETRELLAVVLGKRIAIDLQVAPDTPAIVADTGDIELALIHLGLHARAALQPAGPEAGHVWLQAGPAQPDDVDGLPPGAYVRISVRDDGRGIDEGPGLAQVHRFCAAAGGRARISNAPGRGTTVSMILPAVGASPSADRPAAAGPMPPQWRPKASPAGDSV